MRGTNLDLISHGIGQTLNRIMGVKLAAIQVDITMQLNQRLGTVTPENDSTELPQCPTTDNTSTLAQWREWRRIGRRTSPTLPMPFGPESLADAHSVVE